MNESESVQLLAEEDRIEDTEKGHKISKGHPRDRETGECSFCDARCKFFNPKSSSSANGQDRYPQNILRTGLAKYWLPLDYALRFAPRGLQDRRERRCSWRPESQFPLSSPQQQDDRHPTLQMSSAANCGERTLFLRLISLWRWLLTWASGRF